MIWLVIYLAIGIPLGVYQSLLPEVFEATTWQTALRSFCFGVLLWPLILLMLWLVMSGRVSMADLMDFAKRNQKR